MANTNAFGIPETKKDVKNRSIHARTGNPNVSTQQVPNAFTTDAEAQNMQHQAILAAEQPPA